MYDSQGRAMGEPGVFVMFDATGMAVDLNNPPVNASYVVAGLNPELTNERRLQVGSDLTLADGGANGDITVGLGTTTVTANPYGSATQSPTYTVDTKGRLTAAANVLITPAASSITGGAALTRTDDTNVTLTLGGTPTTALLAAASITVGWSGTLAAARLNANVVQAITNDTNITGSIAAQNLTLAWAGTLAAARLNANVVQAITNDTNINGSIAAQNLTLAWAGLLSGARGGTGVNNGASTITIGGNVTFSGGFTFTGTITGNTGVTFPTSGTLATTAQIPTTDSGVYTPTLTNVANLDASTAYECQYMRIGSTVTVSGRVDIDPTLTATSTQLGISLPIASNLGATEDCAGTAFASGIAGQGAAILGDAANNRAQLQFISTDLTNQAMYFSFTYQVI